MLLGQFENVYGHLIPMLLRQFENVYGHLFIINIVFGSLYLILILIVSHVNLLRIHVSTYAKSDW